MSIQTLTLQEIEQVSGADNPSMGPYGPGPSEPGLSSVFPGPVTYAFIAGVVVGTWINGFFVKTSRVGPPASISQP